MGNPQIQNHDITQLALAIRRLEGIPFLVRLLLKCNLSNPLGARLLFVSGLTLIILGLFLAFIGLGVYQNFSYNWTYTTNTISPISAGPFLVPAILAIWIGIGLLRGGSGILLVKNHAQQQFGESTKVFLSQFFFSKRKIPFSWPSTIRGKALLCVLTPLTLIAYITATLLTLSLLVSLRISPDATNDNSLTYTQVSRDLAGLSVSLSAVLIAILVWAIAFTFHRLIRRTTSIPTKQLLSKDSRYPVLLLRSFLDDNVKAFQPFFKLVSLTKRFEEIIAMSAWRLGPVTSIGHPKERLPKLGASRMYIPDDQWQKVVSSKINQAGAIGVIVGSSTGLEWELHEIQQTNATSKMIVIVPPLKPKQLETKWTQFLEVMQRCSHIFKPMQSIDYQSTLLLLQDQSEVTHVWSSIRRLTWDYEVALYAAGKLLKNNHTESPQLSTTEI